MGKRNSDLFFASQRNHWTLVHSTCCDCRVNMTWNSCMEGGWDCYNKVLQWSSLAASHVGCNRVFGQRILAVSFAFGFSNYHVNYLNLQLMWQHAHTMMPVPDDAQVWLILVSDSFWCKLKQQCSRARLHLLGLQHGLWTWFLLLYSLQCIFFLHCKTRKLSCCLLP